MNFRAVSRRLLLIGLPAGLVAGCAGVFGGDQRTRTLKIAAGPLSKTVRALDKAASAHYQTTRFLTTLAKGAVRANKLTLPPGVTLAEYELETAKLWSAWTRAVDEMQDRIATATDDSLLDADALKGLIAAVEPIADLALKLLPLAAAIAV